MLAFSLEMIWSLALLKEDKLRMFKTKYWTDYLGLERRKKPDNGNCIMSFIIFYSSNII
jgi:hypothetical protein